MKNMEEVLHVLKKGHNSALRLDTFMRGDIDNALLVQEIVCSLSKAIDSLEKASSSKDKKRKVHTTKPDGDHKRRNVDAKSYTKVVRENPEDNYIWRKYGQKEIQGLKHPRCYYRCTNKYDLNCPATKQVQQSEEDPSKYEILYIGNHTCTEFYSGQDTENSSIVINFSSNPAENKSQSFSFPYHSSINSTGSEIIQREEVPSNSTSMQNTAAFPDPMWHAPLLDDHMLSPGIQSSSGSAETTVDFDERLFKLDDPYYVDPFDQFLTGIDNTNIWKEFS